MIEDIPDEGKLSMTVNQVDATATVSEYNAVNSYQFKLVVNVARPNGGVFYLTLSNGFTFESKQIAQQIYQY